MKLEEDVGLEEALWGREEESNLVGPLRIVESSFLSHVYRLQLPGSQSAHLACCQQPDCVQDCCFLPSSSQVLLLLKRSQAFFTNLALEDLRGFFFPQARVTCFVSHTQFLSLCLPFSQSSHPSRSHSNAYPLCNFSPLISTFTLSDFQKNFKWTLHIHTLHMLFYITRYFVTPAEGLPHVEGEG